MSLWQWVKHWTARFNARCMELVTDAKTGRMSLTKLASATAYLAATACFIWFHHWIFGLDAVRLPMATTLLPFMWGIYLGTVGGHHLLSKNLDIKAGLAGMQGSAKE